MGAMLLPLTPQFSAAYAWGSQIRQLFWRNGQLQAFRYDKKKGTVSFPYVFEPYDIGCPLTPPLFREDEPVFAGLNKARMHCTVQDIALTKWGGAMTWGYSLHRLDGGGHPLHTVEPLLLKYNPRP